MATDFMRLVKRPTSLITALRRLAVGSLLTAAGLSASQAAAKPATGAEVIGAVQDTIIVDRSRKRPALLLRLPASASFGSPQHRSHRSHSSHRSSTGGGAVAAPVVPPKSSPPATPTTRSGMAVPPAAATGAATAALGLMDDTSTAVAGIIESFDRQARTITVRTSGAPALRVFAYRDDSKLETITGSSIRFDEFSEMSGGQIPVTKNDKVRVVWRTSTDGKTQIVTSLTKTP